MVTPFTAWSAPEALRDAKARLEGVARMLDVLQPDSGAASPLLHEDDRDQMYRETTIALARVSTLVDLARMAEADTRHAHALTSLGAVS